MTSLVIELLQSNLAEVSTAFSREVERMAIQTICFAGIFIALSSVIKFLLWCYGEVRKPSFGSHYPSGSVCDRIFDGLEKPAPRPTEPVSLTVSERVEPVPQISRSELIGRINKITDDHTRKQLDICYVIENNALFNLKYPKTRAFEEQLLKVQENQNSFSLLELSNNVETLERLWREAVASAEEQGFEGLNDPGTARKAVKVARLAERSTGGEQAAALNQLAALLGVLNLVIPAKQKQQLEAKKVLQLAR